MKRREFWRWRGPPARGGGTAVPDAGRPRAAQRPALRPAMVAGCQRAPDRRPAPAALQAPRRRSHLRLPGQRGRPGELECRVAVEAARAAASRTASRSTWCSFRRCRRRRSIACRGSTPPIRSAARRTARPSCSARIPSGSRRSTPSARSSATARRVGIPAAKYNMNLLGVLRTPDTPGRGGSRYSTWRLRDAKEDPPLTAAGVVAGRHGLGAHHYFLERVVPVADEHKVRLACHPHDPGVPPKGFRGVVRVLGTVDGMKRFVDIKAKPVSRPEPVPGHDGRDAAAARHRDPRRHPLLRPARRRSSTSTSATSADGATTSRKCSRTKAT